MATKAKLIKKNDKPATRLKRKAATKSVRRGGPAVHPREALTGERKVAVDPRAAFHSLFEKGSE